MRYTNITNQKFNRLTAIKYIKTNKFRSAVWLFECDCGKKVELPANTAKSGMTKSCGCLNNEVRRKKHFTDEEMKEKRQNEWQIYYKKNREKLIKKAVENNRKNRDYKKEYQKIKKRKKDDINLRLKINIRNRLLQAIKSGQKGGSFIKNLGCSIDDFKKYLESKFQEGMSWNNYGKWQIDHIKPLCKFDLTDKKQFKKAVNYKNHQPLWAIDNQRKNRKT